MKCGQKYRIEGFAFFAQANHGCLGDPVSPGLVCLSKRQTEDPVISARGNQGRPGKSPGRVARVTQICPGETNAEFRNSVVGISFSGPFW